MLKTVEITTQTKNYNTLLLRSLLVCIETIDILRLKVVFLINLLVNIGQDGSVRASNKWYQDSFVQQYCVWRGTEWRKAHRPRPSIVSCSDKTK